MGEIMREIKFRAWDKKQHEMYSVVLLDFRKSSKGVGIGYINNPSWGVRWPNSEELILMQYTGHKDRNGKEGYRKDIAEDPETGMLFVIDWSDSDGRWILQPTDRTSAFYALPLSSLESFVITSNVYEKRDAK